MTLFKKIVVHTISRQSLGKLFDLAAGSRLSKHLIKPYIKLYKINQEEVRQDSQFNSLTEFFVRDICPSLRPINQEEGAVVSPVDGRIADLGFANQGKVILAKNNSYSLRELLAGLPAEEFQDGFYLNIYLSPKNYHRIHMPHEGRTIKHRFIPGQVFPVNELGVSTIKDLFAKNRRTCSIFETPEGIRFCLIKVGALGVGKIVSSFQEGQDINRGAEIGRFEFGSTVILIFQGKTFKPMENLAPGMEVTMGQKIGEIKAGD
ncbi:archaetidylserine decarboxylase [Desulforamulus aquiferis]|uniref:phosphatidylserine decarboxylase n=1 Tax=Desulforamulus aquiferis TaxID=1397668 RepID=A0AAW7ZC09_9FIRM|nr:archaetidylserine decarboxylase [Desulforamulus aquiferis]MDO7786927.1 archaetidylserine decarboxylase [Desulforamulus aquiferis]RYD03953.1 hypothetical protein N752_17880 [Desulforamulus aquiferis]